MIERLNLRTRSVKLMFILDVAEEILNKGFKEQIIYDVYTRFAVITGLQVLLVVYNSR